MEWSRGTWLADESYAYPNGGQTRKGSAVFPDGQVRRVWAGIPDTYFTIPAHGRIGSRYVAGWLTSESVTYDDGSVMSWLAFNIRERMGK